MTIDDKIRDENLQCNSNREAANIYLHYQQLKLRNMNTLQAKKCYLLIKVKLQNNASLFILLYEKLLKKRKNEIVAKKEKQQQLKIELKSKQQYTIWGYQDISSLRYIFGWGYQNILGSIFSFYVSNCSNISLYMVTSVVLYSLTRATMMSNGKDETRVCGYRYTHVITSTKIR